MSFFPLQETGGDFGTLAQWLEQGSHKPLVVGSNPTCPISKDTHENKEINAPSGNTLLQANQTNGKDGI